MKNIIDYISIELHKKDIRLYDSNILSVIRRLSISDIKQFESEKRIIGIEIIIKQSFQLI